MKYARLFLATLFLFAVVGVLFDWSLNGAVRIIGFEPPKGMPSPRPILLDVLICGTAMLLGMIGGTVYESIKSRKTRINLRHELIRAIGSPRFAICIVVAPLLFAGVYSAARAEPDVVVAAAFAFQNGFFCDRIVNLGETSEPK
jgi:hypothetical protein